MAGAIRLAVNGEDDEPVPPRPTVLAARPGLLTRPLAPAGAAGGPQLRELAPEPIAEAERWTKFPAGELSLADCFSKAGADDRTGRVVLRGMPRGSWPEPRPRTDPSLRNRCWRYSAAVT